jgi:hypothetical protein
MAVEREANYRWAIEHNMVTGFFTVNQKFDEGRIIYNEHNCWTTESTHDEYFTIHPDDPNSAKLDITWTEHYQRGDWQVSSTTRTVVTSTRAHFIVEAELEAREGDEIAYQQTWNREIARNHV